MLLNGWESYDYIFGEFRKAEGGSLNLQDNNEGLATDISTQMIQQDLSAKIRESIGTER